MLHHEASAQDPSPLLLVMKEFPIDKLRVRSLYSRLGLLWNDFHLHTMGCSDACWKLPSSRVSYSRTSTLSTRSQKRSSTNQQPGITRTCMIKALQRQ